LSEVVGVVGDVHGNIAALSGLIKSIDGMCDRIVFAGDYVNRGRYSAEVIQFLIDYARNAADATFIAGNHDIAFLDCLTKGELTEFLVMGGAATINSYISDPEADVLDQLQRSVPSEHLRFLQNLQPHYFDDGLLITHDGKEPRGFTHPVSFRIYGHVPQRGLRPMVSGDKAAIDTGCGTLRDGRLSCFFWPTMDFVQVDPSGCWVDDPMLSTGVGLP
jgi:serine/threonine protein phosphatase 1